MFTCKIMLFFLKKCDKFIPENINEFIEPRAIYDEDGMKISEWVTDMKKCLRFFFIVFMA